MKNRGFTEAREQLPILRPHFFAEQAEAFVPFHSLKPAAPVGRSSSQQLDLAVNRAWWAWVKDAPDIRF
jgi:hypothetical protein